jgi:hypothetical protein
MKNFNKFILTAVILFAAQFIFADSPLSQTKFFTAYYLNEKVQYAEELGFLDGVLAGYLMDQSVTIDLKAAVINTLPVSEKGKNNKATFEMFLGRKYGKNSENLNYSELSGDELFCLGYLTLMIDSKDVTQALSLLKLSSAKNSSSYTINLIYNLALAQNYLAVSDKCNAWSVCNMVRTNHSLNHDLNDEAGIIIFEQVDKYKDTCD